ncbi:bifunctional PIG-L family deacetylase/class I SAM-dependent methyltransferase [Arthrobacter sp. UM1]|uniref:bifunctional PIG-L family deacetylase/class I SAM-dependent methyltransferase n=1 Tax=Arthrobacter sp. UM1 TaxID=2766776 RepID=UPI001CF695E9|nr:PIG-L family deacetylase [Arthrobacter sp. UM1]MCB4209059.1 PIG-L family deacetylase [Arthrobacter sp. UM1]
MTFRHTDPSTPEEDWAAAGALDLPLLDPDVLDRAGGMVVAAAHPDDELLGAAALLAEAERRGLPLVTVLAALGEGSHPDSPTHAPKELAERRREEYASLASRLFPSADSRVLGLPDGGLGRRRDDLDRALEDALRAVPAPAVVVCPHREDAHADHVAVAEAARAAAQRAGAVLLEYPIWYWHWARPEDGRWRSWKRVADPEGLDRRALWTVYPSQTEPLSAAEGDEAILPPGVLAHFLRGADTVEAADFSAAAQDEERDASVGASVNDARTAAAVFDRLHHESEDPWDLYESPYERRKRDQLVGLLERERLYGRAFEIGCSVGALSQALLRVSPDVVAVDASSEAVGTAQRRSEGIRGLDFRVATVPDEWPEGEFELVVLSETGYYLSREQLEAVWGRIEASTPRTFTLALCHWRGDVEDWPLDARQVHASAREHWPEAAVRSVEDPEFLIDILTVERGA